MAMITTRLMNVVLDPGRYCFDSPEVVFDGLSVAAFPSAGWFVVSRNNARIPTKMYYESTTT